MLVAETVYPYCGFHRTLVVTTFAVTHYIYLKMFIIFYG